MMAKGCFKELNRILVVKKIMAITTSKSKYCLLSFFPQPQLSLSDWAVYPIGNSLLNSSRSRFRILFPCSPEPIYSYCRHNLYCWFSLATCWGICPFSIVASSDSLYCLSSVPYGKYCMAQISYSWDCLEESFIFSEPFSATTEPISIFLPYIGRMVENRILALIFSCAIRSRFRLK